jgi:hypothetical protein
MHFRKVYVLEAGGFASVPRWASDLVVEHYMACGEFGMTVNKVQTEPRVNVVLNEKIGKTLEVFAGNLRQGSLAVHETVVPNAKSVSKRRLTSLSKCGTRKGALTLFESPSNRHR